MGKHFIKTMLPLSVLIICIFCVIFVIIQHDIRIGGNDPQIQIAEDIANELNHHQRVTLLPKVSLSESIAAFIIIFGKDGRPVSSSAELNGEIPTLPAGVFTYLNAHQEDRFTWQPDTNIRLAAVALRYSKGYVLAGRSLREIEIRESSLFYQVLIGWFMTLFTTMVCVLLTSFLFPNNKK